MSGKAAREKKVLRALYGFAIRRPVAKEQWWKFNRAFGRDVLAFYDECKTTGKRAKL